MNAGGSLEFCFLVYRCRLHGADANRIQSVDR